MKWWTVEQALAWGMWRNEARAERCGEGRRGALEPCQLAEVPKLTEAEWQHTLTDLLIHGEVCVTVLKADGSDRILEERGYEHEESGCYVFLRGCRPHPDAPLCITEALHWIPPREEPILDYLTAKTQLEEALREDRVHATGQGNTGHSVDIPAKSWLFANISLTADGGSVADDTVDQSGASRLRFPIDELKALWPSVNLEPEKLSARSGYQRKRGRPAMPTETMTTMAATMLEQGFSKKQVLEVLRRAVALERNVSQDAALRVARTILGDASVGNS